METQRWVTIHSCIQYSSWKFILILQNNGRGRILPTSNIVQDELCSCKDPGHSYWSPAVRIHISWQKTDIIFFFFFFLLHSWCDRIELWLTYTSTVAKRKVIKLILVIKKSHFPPPRKMHATGWQRTKFYLPSATVSLVLSQFNRWFIRFVQDSYL